MRRVFAFLFALVVARGASAGDARVAALVAALDHLLGHERPAGAWTYETPPGSPPGTRPPPWTDVLRLAERIAVPLGLASWDVVVVRSPGAPAGGLVLLGGYRVTGRATYLAAARRTGDLLVALQLPSGGWFSEMPAQGATLARWFALAFRRTTIDDDVTPGAVRLLLALAGTTGEARYRDAAARGVEFLLRTQRPDGAWPLVWRPWWERPFASRYEGYATLNDGATTATVDTLLVAARVLGRSDCLAAARRGGQWLVRAQGARPQAAWAQQYDARGMPAPARPFEPAALAAWETRFALDTLLALAVATGDRAWCAPVPGAVDWLVRSALRPGCWARFYAPGTNAPIYLGPEGTPVADPGSARPSYTWTGDFGIPFLLARLGIEAARGAGPLEAPLMGDPGLCPGDPPPAFDRSSTRDPRALIAHAAVLLAALDPPPPAPCRP